MIVSKSSLAAVADLAGKTLGILPGSANDLVSRQCLANAGFDFSKLTAANIGGTSAIVAALLAARIDAGPVHYADGYAAIQKSNGALKILLECGKSIPNYPQTGMMSTGAWLRSNQQLAQILVDGYVDAARWANTNKDEFISRSAVWSPEVPAELRAPTYDAFKSYKFWPVNGGIDQASLQAYISVAAGTGAVKGNFPTTEKWVDQTFVNDYLKRRGSQ